MDKNTLSNYGWIVTCVLVLAVMIALSTPFGTYIKDAVWSTTEGLFDVSENALNIVGMTQQENHSKTVTGSHIFVNDVNSTKHNLVVKLSSDTITDFSNVTIKRIGQNLINPDVMVANGDSDILQSLEKNNDGSFTLRKNGESRFSQFYNTYIPANTPIHLTGTVIEKSANVRYMSIGLYDKAKNNAIWMDLGDIGNDEYSYVADFDVEFVALCFSNSTADGEYLTFKDLQLSAGSVLVPNYKPYEEQTIKANSDGTVTGITSTAPAMLITTDNQNVELSCTYQTSGVIDKELDLSDKKIINFGDSIFGSYVAPADISSQISTLTGATVYNIGFGGCQMGDRADVYNAFSMHSLADSISKKDFTTQEQALSNYSFNSEFTTNLNRLKSIDFSEVDIITIAYGTNDFNSSRPLSKTDKYDVSSYEGALRYSIEKISNAYPNIEIVVCTPIYRAWFDDEGNFLHDSDTYVNTVSAKLPQYGDSVKKIADEYGLQVIDFYNGLGWNKNNMENYFLKGEGTHPKLSGRLLMAEYMSEELYKQFG